MRPIRKENITIEQAARWFENRAVNTPIAGARAMFEIAANALREKLEYTSRGATAQPSKQSKPCILCESDKIHILVITKEPEQLFSFSTEETGLMFCPMCGRDLRGVK